MPDGGEESAGEGSRDDLDETLYWLERELREARQALWDGKSGKAFSAIEAAQDEFDKVEEVLNDAE